MRFSGGHVGAGVGMMAGGGRRDLTGQCHQMMMMMMRPWGREKGAPDTNI